MNHKLPLVFRALLLLASIIGFGELRPLRAHGGGELVVGLEPAGPYAVSVWVNPPQPNVAEPVHFTVGVADLADGSPVLDAVVLITMQPVGAETAVSASATTAQSTNKLFYETDLIVSETGEYNVTVLISGDAGQGEIKLPVSVETGSSINWLWWGLAGLVIILIISLWRTQRQR